MVGQGGTVGDDFATADSRRLRRKRAAGITYWAEQAAHYAPPRGQGMVRFTARHQHAAVMKLLAPRGGERVLDAGCGSGLLSRALTARGARVCAVDYSPEMITLVEAETVICADLETLDLGLQFDAVVCAGALNFLDAEKAIARLAGHTRPGGLLVVMVTRASLAGLAYVVSRRIVGVPFHLWSVRSLTGWMANHGLALVARQNTLPHDVVLAFAQLSGS